MKIFRSRWRLDAGLKGPNLNPIPGSVNHDEVTEFTSGPEVGGFLGSTLPPAGRVSLRPQLVLAFPPGWRGDALPGLRGP